MQLAKEFDEAKIKHPKLLKALKDVERLSAPYSGTNVILLVGPTGAGKSTLIEKFVQSVLERERASIISDPTYIPVAGVVAPAIGQRTYSYRSLFEIMLAELNEPLIDQKFQNVLIDKKVQNYDHRLKS